jgi:hypothetical protein
MFKNITLGAAAALTAVAAIPAAADAHPRGRANGYYNNSAHSSAYRDGYYQRGYNDRYYDDRYYEGRSTRDGYRRCSGTTGTILGGVAGALLGRAIDSRGSRVTGTIVGGAGGALLGREVGKSSCRR